MVLINEVFDGLEDYVSEGAKLYIFRTQTETQNFQTKNHLRFFEIASYNFLYCFFLILIPHPAKLTASLRLYSRSNKPQKNTSKSSPYSTVSVFSLRRPETSCKTTIRKKALPRNYPRTARNVFHPLSALHTIFFMSASNRFYYYYLGAEQKRRRRRHRLGILVNNVEHLCTHLQQKVIIEKPRIK